MGLYIQLRDEIVDEEQVRQMWIKADNIEVTYDGITYLDSDTGSNDGWDSEIPPFDFMFIRDRLLENCKVGYVEGVEDD